MTFTPATAGAVAVDANTVTAYKVTVPDDTYYVYAVLDTSETTAITNTYNTGIAANPTALVTGTAELGSTDTILIDDSLTDLNIYVGARVIITAGTALGESRAIVAYDGTKTLTVSPVFTTALDTTSVYRINVPETSSVSLGTVTITNHTVNLDVPSTFHGVGDFFNVGVMLDTNGQAITGSSIYINFSATTLELADQTTPYSKFIEERAATSNGATAGNTIISTDLTSTVDDFYNTFQVVITSGAAVGERSTISDYTGASQTITVSPAFSAQVKQGVSFTISQPLTGTVSLGTNAWNATVVKNSGSNADGEADFVAISSTSDAKAIIGTDKFLLLTFKTLAAGNTDIKLSFNGGRATATIDNTGNEHLTHGGNAIHISTVAAPSASISGTILLEGRTDHQENVTLELRQTGSLGHVTTYTAPEDTDATTPGIQLQTATDGTFKITNVPSGTFFLTAKASHYLRGQNDASVPIQVTPGKVVTSVLIKGFNDANSDGDFADAGEEFGTLLAGETGTEDNQITAADVTTFASNFGLTAQTALDAADIDGDNDVDVDDFMFISKNFGKTAIAPIGVAGVVNASPSGKTIASPFELAGLPSEIELGEEIGVEVQLKHASHVAGYAFELTLDPRKAAVSQTAEGNFLKLHDKTFFVSNQERSQERHKLIIANASKTSVSGSGTALSFTLKPSVLGDVILTLGNVQLVDGDGKVELDGSSKEYTVRVIPKKIVTQSVLLQNYPNPFNPETWMPYALKDGAEVTIRIYNATGQVVRTLDLGFQKSAEYFSRDQAAYWDGRNDMGEHIASGVYFYQIDAGDFSATRKMVILK